MGERGITMSEVKSNFYYCPKCLQFELDPKECGSCRAFFNKYSPVDYIGKITLRELDEFLEDPARKEDPRFDQELFDHRINYVPIQYEDLLKDTPITSVSCPYCHSKKTKKISSGSKLLNTALFGAFGNKRRYQWHCNSCDSDF